MKKFKKFLVVATLMLVGAITLSMFKDNGIVAKAASLRNGMTTPQLNYAFADASGEVTVSFKAVKNATKYRVYRKTNGTDWTCIKTTAATKLIDKTAKKNKTYYYTVRAARNVNGKTVYSSYVKNGIKATKINPTQPKMKSAKATSQGIEVSWNASKNSTKYIVYRRLQGYGWKRVGVTSKTSFLDKEPTFGNTYYYTVKACRVYDRVEYYSSYQDPGIIGATYYPGEPEVTLAVFQSGSAHITWKKAKAANYYRVLRKNVGGQFEEIATTSNLSYIDETAEDYRSYYYTVQAVNNSTGMAYYSSYDKVGLLMSKESSDFSINEVKVSFGNVKLSWNKYENAEGYVIYRKRTNESDDTYQLIKNIKFKNKTTYTDKDVARHTEYTYVVKPYFADADNSNLFAIATINTCDGKSETNVDPDQAAEEEKESCEVTVKETEENNSAQSIMDEIYDDDTVNKSFSVIGDSISTFPGYSSGNNFYPKNDVNVANDIWWKKAANSLGMDIVKVNAYAGRRVTTTGTGNTSAVEKCLNVTANGQEPDVIIIACGINDFRGGVELGSFNSSKKNLTSAVSKNTTVFVDSYCVMINKLRSNYPDAKIVISTIPSGCVDNKNKNGDSLASWNNQIKKIANGFGLSTINFDRSNLNSSKRNSATIDGIHPNEKGQKYLADKAIADLKSIL